MKKSLLSAAMVAMIGLASSNASAEFLDFTIQEGVVPGGTQANIFTADKLNGGYTEYLAPTSPNTFAASAYANFGQFFGNEGADLVPTQLNNLFGGYGLYALFTAAGNITGPNQFKGTSGFFSLYIDPDMDTKFTAFNAAESAFVAPAPDAVGSADDILLAFTSGVSEGTGNLTGPPGAFDIVFQDFTLTAFGSTYFIAPNPFHMLVQSNGDYDAFEVLADGFTARVTGDVSAVFFKTPEPGSLALMGLALAGLGFAQRRRRSAGV